MKVKVKDYTVINDKGVVKTAEKSGDILDVTEDTGKYLVAAEIGTEVKEAAKEKSSTT